MQDSKPRVHVTRSLWVLKLLLILVFTAMIVSFGFWHERSTAESEEEHLFVQRQIRKWKTEYGDSNDVQVADISIHFYKQSRWFTQEEGIVLAPVALQMTGIQEVLEIAAFPSELKCLSVGGIQCLTWEYAGLMNRDMSMKSLALVRRLSRPGVMPPPDAPLTIETLPEELRFDALSRAANLKEHGLHLCTRFSEWVETTAGEGSGYDQFMNIVNHLSSRIEPEKRDESIDDICKAIRKDTFTLHRAHVVAIMAARELGIPCFGFAGADTGQAYLVGIFSDATGWMFVNLEKHDGGFMQEIPVFLTCLPIVGSFEGTTHDFWYPQANVVKKGYWGDDASVSIRTAWQNPGESIRDVTTAVSRRLAEWQ